MRQTRVPGFEGRQTRKPGFQKYPSVLHSLVLSAIACAEPFTKCVEMQLCKTFHAATQ